MDDIRKLLLLRQTVANMIEIWQQQLKDEEQKEKKNEHNSINYCRGQIDAYEKMLVEFNQLDLPDRDPWHIISDSEEDNE